MARPKFYFYCYPWDLEDEGLEESLGRLAGEIGVDGITVAATTAEILQFRPRMDREHRVFRTEAGAHFQPDSKLYSSCRIKPHPAAWMKSRNALQRIVRACEKLKLGVRASICCCVGREMVGRYPFAACVNPFGVSSDRVLCPANPEVKQYLGALAEDLSSNYGFELLEFSDLRYISPEDYDARELIAPTRSDAINEMLSLCFCPSCRQVAIAEGLDIDHVEESLSRQIEHWLNDSPAVSQTVNDLFAKVSGSALLRVFQSNQIGGLLNQLRNRAKNRTSIGYRPRDHLLGHEMMKHVDQISTGISAWGGNILGEQGNPKEYIDPGRVNIAVELSRPESEDMQRLVSTVHEIVKTRFGSVSFSSYGYAHRPMLDTVRQAIRYAKRETSS